jgi:hypothetical protein
MVPIPKLSIMMHPVGRDGFTLNVSFAFILLSPFTSIVIIFVVSPAAKITIPDFDL